MTLQILHDILLSINTICYIVVRLIFVSIRRF
nr:MAG TPA: hypothetical protein [Caudoviricetes sp.]